MAPGLAGDISEAAGEIEVPILNGSGAPYTSSPVTVTLSVTPSSTPSPPNGDIISGSDTAQNGCAVFLNVDPDPTLTYTVSINNSANSASGVNGAEIVNGQEQSYDNPTPITADSGLAAQVGEPTLAPAFNVGEGAPITVGFTTVGNTSVSTPSTLPVSVADNPWIGGSITFPHLTRDHVPVPLSVYLYGLAGDMSDSNPGADDYSSSRTRFVTRRRSPDQHRRLVVGTCNDRPPRLRPGADAFDHVAQRRSTHCHRRRASRHRVRPERSFGHERRHGHALGEYVIGDTQSKATAVYVWVTNSGVYYSASGMNAPTAGTLATSGVPVTV